jgi:DNA-binding response OmpR family regulator
MSERSILVVDDDADMRDLVAELLGRAGHDVRQASDGRAGLRELFRRPPDLVVLDVSMPELDGWATLERIREVSEVPVLMLTAQSGELDKVRGLRGGADDYVAKPFGRQELLARVEALLRRAAPAAPAREAWSDGWLEIDHARRIVRAGGNDVTLTPLEFRLLSVLAEHAGQVLSADQLLDLVWGDAATNARESVKLYVGYLRRKLGLRDGESPIETVRGFGYRYRAVRS